MLVELFQDCLLSNEFSAGIHIEEYALEALFRVQLVSWPFPALISFRNAIDPLLIFSQEKLGKPAHLLVIFLPQGMFDHDVEVQEHFSKNVVSDLWRDHVGHLVLILVKLDVTEIIELDIAMDVELNLMLPSVISTL